MSRKIVLSDYNSNDTEKRRANLSFIGNNLNIDADKLYVSKFKITSSNLPVWIPNIIETPEKYIASDTYTEYFADQPEFWNTDIAICVVDSVQKRYCNVPVKFTSSFSRYPQNEPNYQRIPSRQEVLNNDFFYTFTSLELLNAISSAVNNAFIALGLGGGGLFNVVKDETSYQFLQSETVPANNYFIYVNEKFQRLFNLHYGSSLSPQWRRIIFDSTIMSSVGNNIYFIASTLSFNTRIFPFTNLVFSSNLQVQPIQRIEGADATTPASINEIFSFYLTISDVDAVGDCIFYIASNWFDGNPVTGIINQIKLDLLFQTEDGYYLPLVLYPADSVSLTLLFTTD
jgi:hypothetical protein